MKIKIKDPHKLHVFFCLYPITLTDDKGGRYIYFLEKLKRQKTFLPSGMFIYKTLKGAWLH